MIIFECFVFSFQIINQLILSVDFYFLAGLEILKLSQLKILPFPRLDRDCMVKIILKVYASFRFSKTYNRLTKRKHT